jgi:hypothetical protein
MVSCDMTLQSLVDRYKHLLPPRSGYKMEEEFPPKRGYLSTSHRQTERPAGGAHFVSLFLRCFEKIFAFLSFIS